MSLFSVIFVKIVPLYLNILLGFFAGKYLNTPRDTIARMMFFMINPLVVFNGVINTRIDSSILSLPLVVCAISCGLCLFFYRFSKEIWDDSTPNLIGYSAGSGNTGYFGLPLALILFNEQGEGVYLMAMLGITLYDNTLGFYIAAKGQHSPAECLQKLIRLPMLYAFALALLINYLHLPIPEIFNDFIGHIKGTFTVLGMMIIGVGLASLPNFKLDGKFIGITFLSKFVVWPAVVLGLIFLDKYLFGIYSSDIHQALILLSIVPVAVSTVIMASVLNTQPEKAAVAVLLSTLFALVYVPLMAITFITVTAPDCPGFNP